MSRNKPLLSAKHILEKEFRIDTKGYRMTEVDVFLDAVYDDYVLFEEKLSKLNVELNEERNTRMSLEREVEKLKARLEITEATTDDSGQITNVDLLKRLSELEKMVYKK